MPVRRIMLGKEGEKRDAWSPPCLTSSSPTMGVARGIAGETGRAELRRHCPYTPAWQGGNHRRARAQVITVARQFADNADKRTASRWSSSALP